MWTWLEQLLAILALQDPAGVVIPACMAFCGLAIVVTVVLIVRAQHARIRFDPMDQPFGDYPHNPDGHR